MRNVYFALFLLLSFSCGREIVKVEENRLVVKRIVNRTGNHIVDNGKKKFNELTQEEKFIILEKGTERPYTGKYNNFKKEGFFICKHCNQPLFNSDDKFDSRSGWPSFDESIEGHVKQVVDADGRRIEIICSNCEGHLGHIFKGEGFTDKNVRYCVNSLSLNFVEDKVLKKAIFASGCFWGTEYHLQKVDGVIETTVGYIGGKENNPTYRQVSRKQTGHAEAVEVVYDPQKVSYEYLAKLFFETHDPTQLNRQGPDIGEQYRSEVFVFDSEQRNVIDGLISQLKEKGYDVVTKVTDATTFWSGEEYHQNYYDRNKSLPYCHIYEKKF